MQNLLRDKKSYIPFIIASIPIIFIISFVIYSIYSYYNIMYIEPFEKFKDLYVGMTAEEILNKYGKPKHIAHDQKEYDKYLELYSTYYPHPNRNINNQVFVYEPGPIYVIFIYIAKNNKVEFIHWAKT